VRDRSYAGAVRTCFARLQFLRLVAIASAATFMIQTSIIWRYVKAHPNAAINPDAVKVEIGALLVFYLSIRLSGWYAKRMKYAWDHAMVSNLAKNVGGGYEQGARDRISDIIVR
jgi:hypothetical protein